MRDNVSIPVIVVANILNNLSLQQFQILLFFFAIAAFVTSSWRPDWRFLFTKWTKLVELNHFFVAMSVHFVRALELDILAETLVHRLLTHRTYLLHLCLMIMFLPHALSDALFTDITVKEIFTTSSFACSTPFAMKVSFGNIVVEEGALATEVFSELRTAVLAKLLRCLNFEAAVAFHKIYRLIIKLVWYLKLDLIRWLFSLLLLFFFVWDITAEITVFKIHDFSVRYGSQDVLLETFQIVTESARVKWLTIFAIDLTISFEMVACSNLFISCNLKYSHTGLGRLLVRVDRFLRFEEWTCLRWAGICEDISFAKVATCTFRLCKSWRCVHQRDTPGVMWVFLGRFSDAPVFFDITKLRSRCRCEHRVFTGITKNIVTWSGSLLSITIFFLSKAWHARRLRSFSLFKYWWTTLYWF